jgi:uncharacterized protein
MEAVLGSSEVIAEARESPGAAPVALGERFASIDLVRGFALLGILVMNIIAFALPDAVLLNPTLAGGFSGPNFAVWLVSALLFDHKMMTTFSMLFGAGIVLFTSRAEARGGSPARLFYRRAGVLLVFGLVHAYLLWYGDILYSYALCGMVAYLFRRRPPWLLLPLGLVALVPPVLIMHGSGIYFERARAAAARVEAAEAAGTAPAAADKALAAQWKEIRQGFNARPEEIARQIKVFGQGTYAEIARERAATVIWMQTFLFAIYVGWDALGRMLIGMGLLKLGVLTAARSSRFYLAMMLLGYGLGLPLVAAGIRGEMRHHFDLVYWFGAGSVYNDFGSILVALGHIAALVLIYKSGAGRWLTRRLAAVGQMAFSNYLMHTLICTTLFYGYGLGLFGKLDRMQLLGVVIAVWVLQLWLSPLWLRSFQFGPAEWLWRSLTYGKSQPMRRVQWSASES